VFHGGDAEALLAGEVVKEAAFGKRYGNANVARPGGRITPEPHDVHRRVNQLGAGFGGATNRLGVHTDQLVRGIGFQVGGRDAKIPV
jgi:hypothetical protein